MTLPANSLYLSDSTIDWYVSDQVIPYGEALDFMENRVEAISNGGAREAIWFLEHPPLYTAGTSAQQKDLVNPQGFPVYEAGRGGQYTYHGPGQRVAYVMLDLNKRQKDIRAFVTCLETIMIDALAELNIKANTYPDRVGVWVKRENARTHEDKIGAIGVRLKKWVSFHGLAINIEPDLNHFNGITPCGISQEKTGLGVTSLWDLGHHITMAEFDSILKAKFEDIFGKLVKS